VAAAIFDRYIIAVGPQKFDPEQTVLLATIATLMSAKLEQPMSPSFTRMINLLTSEEKKTVSKQQLIYLESDILIRLGFDFNFQGPIQSLERYLRILNYDHNEEVLALGFEICKFQLNDARCLDMRPSQIAACAAIIAINIFNKDQGMPFEVSGGQLILDTDIWNNEKVGSTSGYQIADLKQCLYDLTKFMAENLIPNRLENFDLEAINRIQPYNQTPNSDELQIGQQ